MMSHILPTTSLPGCRQRGAEQPDSLHPLERSLQMSPGAVSSGLGKAGESEPCFVTQGAERVWEQGWP